MTKYIIKDSKTGETVARFTAEARADAYIATSVPAGRFVKITKS